jgi:putative endonuclease
MFFVYILRSSANPRKTYVGFTNDLEVRLREHNSGRNPFTAKFLPWDLEAYVACRSRKTAISLEKYFKSGSGAAFWKKRLLEEVPNGPPKPSA